MPTITTDDGIELTYEFEGAADAPVLLFSNSLGTDLGMWEDQLEAFSATRRILRYDSRGHGRSGAPKGPYSIERLGRDVLCLMDMLGLEKVDYCGLSKGGMVGMWLGINAGDRFGKMVYANTAAHMPTEEMWHHRAATVRANGMQSIVAAVVNRWFTEGFQTREPERVARIREMILATSPEGYAGCCEAIAAMDQREAIKAIGNPVLVIAGAEDAATPPDHAHQIAEAIAGAGLVVLPDAAHLSNIEQRDLFNEAVANFLAD
ncbi:3-oxoadipate enol-lactonase [Breoghania corrubedonensis]|uniref:3-oxoadipate enol-lactonase n=1 Tax=Breoghania corrubedonensis TaxID=665038 RepID=A0A2T5VDA0_9HYPH|nr:3-oxoadipate enol-lactonase [Breoghania corrubedonensis]PTW61715.1 3-oxoadipate enol-lactonase [Breoghania corrubedonensis]